jgi:hypothetical protein
LFFYVKNTNGRYYPKFACKTGYTVSDCTSNNTVEIGGSGNDEGNLAVGTTYTMIACAVPNESRYTSERLYKCDNDQLGLAILPLTLNGGTSNEIITFTVVKNPTPPDADVAVTLLDLGDCNSNSTDQGRDDMDFSKVGTTIT